MMSNLAEKSAMSRINALVDESSFVEIGGLVNARSTDFNMQSIDTPADGVVTGYGVIDGNLVYVYSQDASVLGGTIGEMHAKKISKIYDLAMKVGAPVVGLIDCAGLRLQESTDALEAFGDIYKKQALASGVIPQITAIFGTCGGGLSIVPTLTDFTLMAEDGKLFVNSPNALDGNDENKCDTASAKYQSEESGLCDFTGSESDVLAQVRQLISILPSSNEEEVLNDCVDDLNRTCADLENCTEDTKIALSNISDNNFFMEVKGSYAKEMVTGFMLLNGATVGAVANRTKVYDDETNVIAEFEAKLTTAGATKAAEFVEFCDAFNIPVVSLTNTTGFAATIEEEKTIAKAVAKLTYAFANATVPKVNVVVGHAFGSAYVAMNSKSVGADIVYAWPNTKIGTMYPKEAVRIIYADELKAATDKEAFLKEKADEYRTLQSSAVSAAKRGYVDSIIEARDTRKYLIGALEMLYSKREDRPDKKHGTV